jgi:hypothetical protein
MARAGNPCAGFHPLILLNLHVLFKNSRARVAARI